MGKADGSHCMREGSGGSMGMSMMGGGGGVGLIRE